jgi:SAM-dependent methyltransferase
MTNINGSRRESSSKMSDVLSRQQDQWEGTYSEEPNLFGELPSFAARTAAEAFKENHSRKILDLGCGHGRDTLFFAQQGFTVNALDYSKNAIDALTVRAKQVGLSNSIVAQQQDVRSPLPFGSESMDGCYSHMLCCMALTTVQLESLFQEIKRVLKPNGLNIYSVRRTDDPHYGRGIARGEDMFEIEGFVVHFFNEAKVRALSKGFEVVKIDSFEEGELPRRLFLVTLRKRG